MKQVVLIFPNASAIADFIVKEKVSGAHVSSIDQSVTSILTDKQITTAETIYKAMVKKMVSH